MLENTINEENMNYIQEYFHFPLFVLRKKIKHVFDDCTDIRLNDMIRLKFDTAIKKQKILQNLKSEPQNIII